MTTSGTSLPTLSVGIVDDEELGRTCVRSALREVPGVEITVEAGTAAEAARQLALHRPMVLFLDVRLPDGDGFAILSELPRDYVPYLVIVTAHQDHALTAYEVLASEYVLKPFTNQRIRDAIERARRRAVGSDLAELVGPGEDITPPSAAPPAREAAPTPARRMAIREGDRRFYLSLADVDRFEAKGNLIRVHSRHGVHEVRMTIRELMAHVDPSAFLRIHRSTVIRIGAVKEIQPWFGGDYIVLLLDGTQLRLSRTYREEAFRLFR